MYRFRTSVVFGCLLSSCGGGSLPAASRFLHLLRSAHHASSPLPSEAVGHGRLRGQPRRVLARSLIVETLAVQPVRLERLPASDSGIVELKLDRPEAKNAISKDMLRGIQSALDSVNVDSSVNVVLISSSVPRVFCAGADLKVKKEKKLTRTWNDDEDEETAEKPDEAMNCMCLMAHGDESSQERKLMTPSEVQNFVNSLRSAFTLLEVLTIPTIAVIEGAALGGGLELALSCDLRICGEDAAFAMPETGLAIIPGAGGTQRLPRVVGKAVAKELIFTGRKVGAKEAMSLGLVNHCVPAGDAYLKALEIARDINQKGPLALRMAKHAINRGLEVEMSSALVVEEDCYEKVLNTNDRLEGLAAFAEKRKPIYRGE